MSRRTSRWGWKRTNTSEADMEPWRRQPISPLMGVMRAVLAALVLGLGVGLAIGISEVLGKTFGWTPAAIQICQALLASALVVPAILTLRHRFDDRPWASLGWRRPGGRTYGLGTGVALLTGLLTWGLAALLGWIQFTSFNLTQFVIFLLVNFVALTFFEALPEELAMRGYAWTNLRDGLGAIVATILSIALFLLVPAIISFGRALVYLPTGTTVKVSLFPAGADPIAYVVQLTVFALVLIAARTIHLRGALFAAIGFHTWHLTINRIVLGGLGWVGTGIGVKILNRDAMFLVLLNLLLAGAAFLVLRRRSLRNARTR